MNNLKPCPFCGSEGIEYMQLPGTSWFSLSCRKCCAHGPTKTNKTTSISEWNTRPFEDQQAEQIKKLKEFARSVIRTECWAYPNGGEIQDLAERLGLIKPHVATEADVDDYTDYEVGETIYKFTEILKESEE